MAFQVLGDRRWCEGAEVTSEDMIGQIARYVRHKCEISSGGVRVAIDGCGAAGKTTLADRLSEALQGEVGEVLRLWHRRLVQPRSLAVAVGPHESRGYYLGAFDIKHQDADPLDSLGPGGRRRQSAAVGGIGLPGLTIWPARSSSQLPTRPMNRSSLLFDGVFLLRPELACRLMGSLDLRPPDARGLSSSRCGAGLFAHGGGPETATDRYLNHHLAGQARYHAEASPIDVADIVIENADYENLVFARVS